MRRIVIALVAALVAVPALAGTGLIEKTVIYYEDDMYYRQVGDATFYCNGTIITNGMVTSSAVETYYGC